jgi:hypothetical protein
MSGVLVVSEVSEVSEVEVGEPPSFAAGVSAR